MSDYDPSECSTEVLEHTTAMRNIFIDHWLEGLCQLVPGGDVIKLVFPHGNFMHPDWEFADVCGEDIMKIVCVIVGLAHEVWRDENELERRRRVN